jgi:hypothetical protein
MNRTLLVIGAVVGVTAITMVGGYIGTYTYAVETEEEIRAVYENNENVLGQFYQEVNESSQVVQQFTSDYRDVMTDIVQGRYGDDGIRGLATWINESGVELDPQLYTDLQQVITRGRNDFRDNQTRLIDLRRQYATHQRGFWNRMFYSMMAEPTFDLDTEYLPIRVREASEVFDSGIEEERQIFNRN